MRVKPAIVAVGPDDAPNGHGKDSQADEDEPHKKISLTIDTTTKERFLVTSEVASLRNWEATEAELYAEVIKAYPQFTIERIFREGAISFARRKVAEAHSIKMRGQKTRPGAADKRLARAYERLNTANAKAKAEGRPVRKLSPWTLSETAKTSWRTAARWLAENQEVKPTDS